MGRNLEVALGILNGTIGDYLERRGNELATPMTLVSDGEPLRCEPAAIARAHPDVRPRAVLLVHGLMATEAAFTALDGDDFGDRLARDLDVTPLRLRYNSGRAIADNGAALDALLDALCAAYPAPLEDLLLIGHSMGGLVIRAACHAAATGKGSRWLPLVRRAIYVGTPHRGAPLERAGRALSKLLSAIPDPIAQLASQIADLRSAGLQDLGDAELRHEDRARRRASYRLTDVEHPVPLLPRLRHYLIAGALSPEPLLAEWFGDSIVPLASATNRPSSTEIAPLPADHVVVIPGLTHVELARSLVAYEHVRAFAERDR